MKTIEAEINLMNYFNKVQNTIVPNLTTGSSLVGFETDLLVLTKAGYATAIEIKVSKSDLKADLKKKHIQRLGENPIFSTNPLRYHYKGLKHFYYAVPIDLRDEALEQIPSFCGLICMKENGMTIDGVKELAMKKVRKPKKIFDEKWSEEAQRHLMKIAAIRIYSLKCKLYRTENANPK